MSPLDSRSADIRMFDANGVVLDKKAERKLENVFFREDIRRVHFYEMGDIEYDEPILEYAEHLLASVDVDSIRDAGFRLLVDYDYSEASSVLPSILNELGVTTIPLNAGLREGPHNRTVPEENGAQACQQGLGELSRARAQTEQRKGRTKHLPHVPPLSGAPSTLG